ncbi:hypothetical protein LCGC14_3162770, partial [marine sediment metagenome]
SWPPNAPGEPSIIPLSDDGPLDGEYLYTFRASSSESADSLMSAGYVSAPIRVRNGQVMLKDFIFPAADETDPAPDTIMLFGYRTRANPGRVEESDYAFFFDTIAVATSAAALNSIIYIDSIADAGLSTTDSVKVLHSERIGRDSTGVIDVRYGAPGFLSITAWGSPANSLFRGIGLQQDTLGIAYLITFIDTITGTESDRSPICYVWIDTDSTNGARKPDGIELALPPHYDTAVVRNLYRANILQITYDSVFWQSVNDMQEWIDDHPGEIFNEVFDVREWTPCPNRPNRGCVNGAWINTLSVDTIAISSFRLVKQVPNDTNIVIDTLPYDSLFT